MTVPIVFTRSVTWEDLMSNSKRSYNILNSQTLDMPKHKQKVVNKNVEVKLTK